MESEWETVINKKKLKKEETLKIKRQQYIESGDYAALEALDKKASAKKDKSSKKGTEKKKKVSIKEKNAAKATILPQDGYTLYFSEEKKQPAKSPRKPHAEQSKKLPKEASPVQQLCVRDVSSFNKVVTDIVTQDPENYGYHLYKLSEVFSRCSLVKKERTLAKLPDDLRRTLLSFVKKTIDGRVDVVYSILELLLDQYEEREKGVECIIDTIVITSPNVVYDALPKLAKKGESLEAGLINLCLKVYSFCRPLGLRCFIELFKPLGLINGKGINTKSHIYETLCKISCVDSDKSSNNCTEVERFNKNVYEAFIKINNDQNLEKLFSISNLEVKVGDLNSLFIEFIEKNEPKFMKVCTQYYAAHPIQAVIAISENDVEYRPLLALLKSLIGIQQSNPKEFNKSLNLLKKHLDSRVNNDKGFKLQAAQLTNVANSLYIKKEKTETKEDLKETSIEKKASKKRHGFCCYMFTILGLFLVLLGLVYAQHCQPKIRSYLPAAIKEKLVPHLENLDAQIERVEKSEQVARIITHLNVATEKSSQLIERAKEHSKKYIKEGKHVGGLWLRSVKRKLSKWSSKAAQALNDFWKSEKVQDATAAARRHGAKIGSSCKTIARKALNVVDARIKDLKQKTSDFANKFTSTLKVWADDLRNGTDDDSDD